jgi:L-alanine-DL-glutamate epimerase-like enolase superfamily enzyme
MTTSVSIERVSIPLHEPLVITGHSFSHLNTVWVTLERDGVVGRGEGTGSYYLGETQDTIVDAIESITPALQSGLTRQELQALLPPGGARNAVGCALWDLECKEAGQTIWERVGVVARELTTVATIGVGDAQAMAEHATRWSSYPHLKIKLSAESPVDKMRAIRQARPDAVLVVDANQAWSFLELQEFLPALVELDISMIEQPLPRGGDAELDGFDSPIPLGADESCLSLAELVDAVSRYDVINIKLDKCGGLTEALAMVEAAQQAGKRLMVGNMTGSSLSMAPSFVVGQFCEFVDIDGPLLLSHDVDHGLSYSPEGVVIPPSPALWW